RGRWWRAGGTRIHSTITLRNWSWPTMEPRVLRGTKREIAENLSRIDGEVREVIVFVEPPANGSANGRSTNGSAGGHDIFAEMDAYTVRRGNVDDSRASIYERKEGE